MYGADSSPNGHGHNYVVEVTVEGNPDQLTGMVMDLKKLDDILNEKVIAPMDHRFLNFEVKPFDEIVPTTENLAQEIWNRLRPVLDTPTTSLSKVRVFETADLYVEISASEVLA